MNGSLCAAVAAAMILGPSDTMVGASGLALHRYASAAVKRASSIGAGASGSAGQVVTGVRNWCAGFGSRDGSRGGHGLPATAVPVAATSRQGTSKAAARVTGVITSVNYTPPYIRSASRNA